MLQFEQKSKYGVEYPFNSWKDMFLNSIVSPPPRLIVRFLFYIFCSLTSAFTNCQIKEDQDNEKYFHPNETKTPLIFQQTDHG